ncbi:toxin YdaT family protein [Enterobacter bugandensis]|uniref:Toxin YdaT family protein n=1 Tax=Enterobacter bugandensis TaxID=881260 RepID=A0AA42PW49_9ENTR|nr:toxin YdaT family protein [Enterobacter bugandensis]MDH1321158.1 toxin YdaT family protein [Enterobacter bugandensis]
MKISPPIKAVANELESWALEDGWKAVGMAIADQYHTGGGGDILPAVDTGDGLRNAVQRVKRIFRGIDGPRYAPQAEALKSAALAALPVERRARIESPDDPVLLAAVAVREGIEAVNAVHLKATPEVIVRETTQAIAALIAMRNAAVRQFSNPVFA